MASTTRSAATAALVAHDGVDDAIPELLRTRFADIEPTTMQGAQASLYLVTDNGEPRVVKVYRGESRPKAQVTAKVMTIPSGAIARTLEYGEQDGMSWEIGEYVQGGSLRDVLRAEGKIDRTTQGSSWISSTTHSSRCTRRESSTAI